MMNHRVALLTNFLPPYRIPLLKALETQVGDLRVFVSVPMEPNRGWTVDWEEVEVKVQRTLTFERTWRHPRGFSEPNFVHVPYDTLMLLWRYHPDVVISAEMGARTLQSVVYRRLNRRSRVIIWATLSEHTEQGRGRVRDYLRKLLLQGADAIIVNGASGARYVRRFGTGDAKIFPIPQTTPIAAFLAARSTGGSDHPLRLLNVGHLSELKGILPFVKCLSRWAVVHQQQMLELWLVGDGPLRPVLGAMQYPPNLDVRFWGFVPYDRLPVLYAQSDLLVFPTLADEWGLVVNEAMAAGLPVLGSVYSQAVEELVEEGACGWLFRPDSMEDTANALERVLSTPPERMVSMGKVGQSKISRLTPDVAAAHIAEVIVHTMRAG